MEKELSYTGKLFRRIVISTGFTYGKRNKISSTHLITKFADDYENKLKKIYQRNKKGYWDFKYEVVIDRRTDFVKALKWLENSGYIKVDWEVHHMVTRLLPGVTDYIRLTDKGAEIAPKYLKLYDPDAKGCSTLSELYEDKQKVE